MYILLSSYMYIMSGLPPPLSPEQLQELPAITQAYIRDVVLKQMSRSNRRDGSIASLDDPDTLKGFVEMYLRYVELRSEDEIREGLRELNKITTSDRWRAIISADAAMQAREQDNIAHMRARRRQPVLNPEYGTRIGGRSRKMRKKRHTKKHGKHKTRKTKKGKGRVIKSRKQHRTKRH